jgi:hypothetical protein
MVTLNRLINDFRAVNPYCQDPFAGVTSKKNQTVFDVGTGSVSGVPFGKHSSSAVYMLLPKDEYKRTEAGLSGKMLETVSKAEHQGCAITVTGSEWLRSLEASNKEDVATKAELESFAKESGAKITVLTQNDEAANSLRALKHNIKFKNPNNALLANLTEENAGQHEIGKGSGQGSDSKETGEAPRGANWIDARLKDNIPTDVIVKELIEFELRNMEPDPKLEFQFLQGMLAVACEKPAVMDALGITKEQQEDWKTGQLPMNISKVIDVFGELLKADPKNTPFIATFAYLTALKEKAGDIQVLSMKEAQYLYDKEGNKLVDPVTGKPCKAKISNALGQAIKEFEDQAQRLNAVASAFWKH